MCVYTFMFVVSCADFAKVASFLFGDVMSDWSWQCDCEAPSLTDG